ncbi:MAG: diacylglycerol kinase family protein [Ruthenibacterium sp.]
MRHPRFFDSFRYAANGIFTAVQQERNMRFHLCTAVYVYLFSAFYNFGKTEYAILTVLVCGVLALELINSSLERTVERPSPERYQSAGVVKDMAAGAVLVYSIGAAVCGALLFWDVSVFKTMLTFFMQYPLALICLLASLALSGWFVFGKKG